jgi:hypothetical protein
MNMHEVDWPTAMGFGLGSTMLSLAVIGVLYLLGA